MLKASCITIVTICMGRLAHLRQALPTWLEHTGFPVVVVDYSCPDACGDWIRATFPEGRVRVVRAEAARVEGRALFNPSRARNLGAAAVESEYLLFLDADMLLNKGAEEWIRRHAGPREHLGIPYRAGDFSGLAGAIGVPAASFRTVGGFDETFEGWSPETQDLKLRLHLIGLEFHSMPRELMASLDHSNAERTSHFLEQDLWASRRAAWRKMNEKYRASTGKSYLDWLHEPKVKAMVCQ